MILFKYLRLVSVSGLFLATSSGVLLAQDEAPEQEETQETVDVQAPVAVDAGQKAEPDRRTLYFIGPKVSLNRQLGPSVGSPQSILPRPLVTPGSITVPSPASGNGVPLSEEDENTEEAALESEAPELPALLEAEPTDQEQDLETQQLDQSRRETELDPYGINLADETFDEGTLAQIDPSGIAVEIEGGRLDTVWQGYDRRQISGFLNQLAEPTLSPTLARLASQIAASQFDLPAPEDDQAVQNFIEARLSVFGAQANRQAYVSLIESLPEDFDWSPLAHHFARAHLLKGELTDACQVADSQRANDLDPYWARLSTFCMAANGNRSGVDFQLGILEETTEVDQTFYQLIDQILVEAEQPAGAVLPPIVNLEQALPADILTAAMVRLARVTAPEVDVSNVNPLAVPLLLENALLSRDIHSRLISYLTARGVADPEAVQTFVQAAEFSDEERTAFQSWLQSTNLPEQERDLTDAGGNKSEIAFDSAILQTLMLQTIAVNPAQAPKVLEQYWSLAGDSDLQPATAPIVSKIASLPEVSASLKDPNSMAIVVRAALLAGDSVTARARSRALRTRVAGEDEEADKALIGLVPLIGAEDWLSGVVGEDRLPIWWADKSATENGYKDANLVFIVREAFDMPVSEAMWSAASAGPVLMEGGSISPAMWRTFLVSLQQSDPLQTLSALYRIMTEVAPSDLPPAMAGTLVAGLKQLGFEEIARSFALEILISQKI